MKQNRLNMYAVIKDNNLSELFTKSYGKHYTNGKNDELALFIATWEASKADEVKAKSPKVVVLGSDNMYKSALVAALTILKSKGLLDELLGEIR